MSELSNWRLFGVKASWISRAVIFFVWLTSLRTSFSWVNLISRWQWKQLLFQRAAWWDGAGLNHLPGLEDSCWRFSCCTSGWAPEMLLLENTSQGPKKAKPSWKSPFFVLKLGNPMYMFVSGRSHWANPVWSQVFMSGFLHFFSNIEAQVALVSWTSSPLRNTCHEVRRKSADTWFAEQDGTSVPQKSCSTSGYKELQGKQEWCVLS